MNEQRQEAIRILTENAQRASARVRIWAAIEDAIAKSGAGEHTTIETLIKLYGLGYTDANLKECARNFAVDCANDATWDEYHALAHRQVSR